MKIQNRNRAMLMAVVGGYVIYLAYEIMRDKLAEKSTMPMWACVLCTALMGAAGVAVLVLAWKIYRTKDQEKEEKPDDRTGIK